MSVRMMRDVRMGGLDGPVCLSRTIVSYLLFNRLLVDEVARFT